MKFTQLSLSEFLPYNINRCPAEQIREIINNYVIEIDQVISWKKQLQGFVIAEVIDIKKHPNAEKLKICTVKTNQDTILEIVCGAPNVRLGMRSVFAPIGSVLPSTGMKISEVSIRGVLSKGMLCSEKELGISNEGDSIINFEPEDEAIIGDNPAKALGVDDNLFYSSITPNMSHCLSIKNIARELNSAIIENQILIDTQNQGQESEIILDKYLKKNIAESFNTEFSIEIKNSELCDYYSCIEIKNIDNTVKIPKKITRLLQMCGIDSISPVVDIVNYVMIVLGQPMHAYDSSSINKTIYIGYFKQFIADGRYKFEALNKNNCQLSPDTPIIYDGKDVSCIAGIIGAEKTKCKSKTTSIILEAANFNPIDISIASKALKISTQSQYRFERGIDKTQIHKSLNLAANMICDLCNGKRSELKVQNLINETEREIKINLEKVKSLLSADQLIDNESIKQTIKNLNFKIKNEDKETLTICPPPYRAQNITTQNDVIGEIARIKGYDKLYKNEYIPKNLSIFKNIFQNHTYHNSSIESYKDLKCTRIALSLLGYTETITWSFDSESRSKKIMNADMLSPLTIKNPISEKMNIMRGTIAANLLESVKKNQLKSEQSISIFEIGKVYSQDLVNLEQTNIAIICCGNHSNIKNCFENMKKFNIFDIKHAINKAFSTIFKVENFVDINCKLIENQSSTLYHPTRNARIVYNNTELGTFGEINPIVLQAFEIKDPVYFAEIYYDKARIIKKSVKSTPLKLYHLQPIKRELCFVLDKKHENQSIIQCIKNLSFGENIAITRVDLIDLYEDPAFKKTQHSLSFSIEIQPIIETINSQLISEISEQIVNAVSNQFGAILRLNHHT